MYALYASTLRMISAGVAERHLPDLNSVRAS